MQWASEQSRRFSFLDTRSAFVYTKMIGRLFLGARDDTPAALATRPLVSADRSQNSKGLISMINTFGPHGTHAWLLAERKDASSPASQLLDATFGAVAAKMDNELPRATDQRRKQWLENHKTTNPEQFRRDVKRADVAGLSAIEMLSHANRVPRNKAKP
jgi:hypothetical protein